ncbi:nitronate monooxygenase-like [Papaver somniferum]|uniref:nitronate monooxygenase-like n=1 Tax=Papaver somniferum TaxID=3469 RepID=UPI000E6F7231|nr:nitronate monooxygenase-like [Papaver somniferum]
MGFSSALGWDNGIGLSPIGADIASPKLIALVANAGGLGLLVSPVNMYDATLKAIRDTKKLTSKPFGDGTLLEFDQTNTVRKIFEEKLACMQVFWGGYPKEMVDEAHKNGVKILHQVGSVADAEKAIVAAVDCIITQSVEAGGHVIGTVFRLNSFLPRIVDLVGDRNITVIVVGAIADPRGFYAALSLGAKGICMGTRFIATKESYAHDYYKQRLLQYTGADTEYTYLYSRASWRETTRVLNTPFHQKWKPVPKDIENNEDQPIIGYSIIYGGETILRRFAGQVANQTTVEEVENTVMYTGQGVGHVNDAPPAGDIVKNFIEGAEKIIKGLGSKFETPAGGVAVISLA